MRQALLHDVDCVPHMPKQEKFNNNYQVQKKNTSTDRFTGTIIATCSDFNHHALTILHKYIQSISAQITLQSVICNL